MTESTGASGGEPLIFQPHEVVLGFVGVVSIGALGLLALDPVRGARILGVLLRHVSRLILLIRRRGRRRLVRDTQDLLMLLLKCRRHWLITESLSLFDTRTPLLGWNRQVYQSSLAELDLTRILCIFPPRLIVESLSGLR